MKRSGTLTAVVLVTVIAFATPSDGFAQEPMPAQTDHGIWHEAQMRGFQEWTRGVQATGLQQRLQDRPHTVFIADDMAYQQIPATQRQAWQTDPAAQRAAFGHTIVEGRLTLDDLRQRQFVTTIDGQRLPVRVEGDRVWIGDALVREGDIAAGTGTIHTVDRVILPQDRVRERVRKNG